MSSSKNIKLIGFVSLGLLIGVGGIAIAVPAVTQSARWIQEEDAVKESNAQLQSDLIALEKVEEEHPDVVALNKQLNVKFPTIASGTLLLADVSKAAAMSGISASSIQAVNLATPILVQPESTATDSKTSSGSSTTAPSNESKTTDTTKKAATPQLATMNVEITVVGSGSQLSAFLKGLGQVDRAIKIDSVKISEVKGNDGAGMNSMTISGTTLLYKEITDPATAQKSSTSNSTSSTSKTTSTPSPTATKK